jgi:hypothetical protein
VAGTKKAAQRRSFFNVGNCLSADNPESLFSFEQMNFHDFWILNRSDTNRLEFSLNLSMVFPCDLLQLAKSYIPVLGTLDFIPFNTLLRRPRTIIIDGAQQRRTSHPFE